MNNIVLFTLYSSSLPLDGQGEGGAVEKEDSGAQQEKGKDEEGNSLVILVKIMRPMYNYGKNRNLASEQ